MVGVYHISFCTYLDELKARVQVVDNDGKNDSRTLTKTSSDHFEKKELAGAMAAAPNSSDTQHANEGASCARLQKGDQTMQALH